MNILFVSHAATRGGAAGVLLDLLRWTAHNTQHRATLLSARPGPLEADFARYAAPFSSSAPFRRATQLAGARRRLDEGDWPRKAQLERILSALERLNRRGARRIARGLERFDVVYANSAASGAAVSALEPVLARGAKLVVHVHELGWALSQNEPGWSFLRARGDFFLAASHAVRDELVNHQNIAPERVEVVYEWLDFAALSTDQNAARRALRAQLNAPENAVIVGGCGTIEPRKGADWWLQSAFYALGEASRAGQSPAPLHFAWLSGGDSPFARQLRRDARGFGIENRVHFLPNTNEPKQFFAGLDVFCLASREDPFPLVAVEAAVQSVPLVCFAGAGGAPELARNDAGVVVPWGNCAAMGRSLASLSRDAGFRVELGRKAQERARELCDVERGAAQVMEILERVV